ncbi:hypothetical protein ACVI1L_004586 [Bradyrhizobium sp. USDA 4516]|nr:molybdate transport system ATP-binding protein [Bradyrhizobium sp. USDA 4541]
MSDNLDEIDPKHIAAVFDRPDDVDMLRGDLAQDLARRAVRVCGIIRRYLTGAHGTRPGRRGHYVRARNLDFRASRQRNIVYKLDTNGLAKAAAIAFRALRELVDLLAMGTFCRQQATGGRLRAEFVDPIARDVPLLTAVLVRCLAAWRTFTRDVGTLLFCDRQIVQRWWRDISARLARSWAFIPSCDYLGTMIPERLMTTVRPPDTSLRNRPSDSVAVSENSLSSGLRSSL